MFENSDTVTSLVIGMLFIAAGSTARLFVVIAVGWATLPLSLLLAPETWRAGAALAGWAQGATVTLVFALIAERTTSLKQSARVSGLVQFVGYGAGAVGPILFQTLKTLTGSWTASLLLDPEMALEASAATAGNRRHRRKRMQRATTPAPWRRT